MLPITAFRRRWSVKRLLLLQFLVERQTPKYLETLSTMGRASKRTWRKSLVQLVINRGRKLNVIGHSSLVICHSSFVIRHWSFVIDAGKRQA